MTHNGIDFLCFSLFTQGVVPAGLLFPLHTRDCTCRFVFPFSHKGLYLQVCFSLSTQGIVPAGVFFPFHIRDCTCRFVLPFSLKGLYLEVGHVGSQQNSISQGMPRATFHSSCQP